MENSKTIHISVKVLLGWAKKITFFSSVYNLFQPAISILMQHKMMVSYFEMTILQLEIII